MTGYYRVVQGDDEIVKEVRRQIKEGVDWIKVHVSGVVPHYAHLGERCSWSQKELDLVCEVAHDMGVPVMGHCRGAEAVKRAVKADFDMLFHATGMDEEAIQVAWDGYLEAYHHNTLHANTVGRYTIGNLMLHDTYGPHQRLVFARMP